MWEFWEAVITLTGGPELGQGSSEVNFKSVPRIQKGIQVPGTRQAPGPCWRHTVLRREWLIVYCWLQIRPQTPFSSSLPCQPRATLSYHFLFVMPLGHSVSPILSSGPQGKERRIGLAIIVNTSDEYWDSLNFSRTLACCRLRSQWDPGKQDLLPTFT